MSTADASVVNHEPDVIEIKCSSTLSLLQQSTHISLCIQLDCKLLSTNNYYTTEQLSFQLARVHEDINYRCQCRITQLLSSTFKILTLNNMYICTINILYRLNLTAPPHKY